MKSKVLYYDCFMGISGDMNMAALIDLGVDEKHLIGELEKLNIDDEFKLVVKKDIKNGITGTKVDVEIKHQHSGHGHHHVNHRHYCHIKKMIESSGLSDFVKKRSIETFEKIAVAEAKIHGTTVDKVHFHEVGATDSIVDIVGNAICIEFLNPDLIISSPVQLGGGFVKCEHGTFPVPAPATTEILKNTPVKTGMVQTETTTPTGAAIVKSNATEFTESTEMDILKIGYGLGTKTLEVPNVLRVMWCEKETAASVKQCHVCECNIDDMKPEMYSYIFDKLFAMNVDDVYLSPIMMKKNRPANKLSVICKEEILTTVTDFLLKETTSFGLRYYKANKRELEREIKTIKLDGIEIKIKYAYIDGEIVKHKPEYEDCAYFSNKKGIPLSKVYELVEQQIQNLNG